MLTKEFCFETEIFFLCKKSTQKICQCLSWLSNECSALCHERSHSSEPLSQYLYLNYISESKVLGKKVVFKER